MDQVYILLRYSHKKIAENIKDLKLIKITLMSLWVFVELPSKYLASAPKDYSWLVNFSRQVVESKT